MLQLKIFSNCYSDLLLVIDYCSKFLFIFYWVFFSPSSLLTPSHQTKFTSLLFPLSSQVLSSSLSYRLKFLISLYSSSVFVLLPWVSCRCGSLDLMGGSFDGFCFWINCLRGSLGFVCDVLPWLCGGFFYGQVLAEFVWF